MVKDKSEEQTDLEKFSSGTLQASMEALKEVFISWQLEKNGVEYQFDESASMIDVVDAVAQALVNDVA